MRNVDILVRPPLSQAALVPDQSGRQHQDQSDPKGHRTIAPRQVDGVEGQQDDGGPHCRAHVPGGFVDQGQQQRSPQHVPGVQGGRAQCDGEESQGKEGQRLAGQQTNRHDDEAAPTSTPIAWAMGMTAAAAW